MGMWVCPYEYTRPSKWGDGDRRSAVATAAIWRGQDGALARERDERRLSTPTTHGKRLRRITIRAPRGV